MTKNQAELLSFLRLWFAETEVSPSYREICEALNWSSLNKVSKTVHSLKERGFIEMLPNRHRSIILKSIPVRGLETLLRATRNLLVEAEDKDWEAESIPVSANALFKLGLALAKAYPKTTHKIQETRNKSP